MKTCLKIAGYMFKGVVALFILAGAVTWGLIKGIFGLLGSGTAGSQNNTTTVKTKVIKDQGNWWDYNRNDFDNDIDQLIRGTNDFINR